MLRRMYWRLWAVMVAALATASMPRSLSRYTNLSELSTLADRLVGSLGQYQATLQLPVAHTCAKRSGITPLTSFAATRSA